MNLLPKNLGHVLVAIALCCSAACQRSHGRVGSESHFVTCEQDAECAELGDEFSCQRGLCRPADEPPEAAQQPDEAAAGAGASASDPDDVGELDDAPVAPEPSQPSALGGCDLDTPFIGDEFCLAAPDADQGIQIHVGPSDYTDPAALQGWVYEPGQEDSDCWSFKMPNTRDIAYAEWEFSARPGLHHALTSFYRLEVDIAEGRLEVCRDVEALVAGELAGELPVHRARVPRAPVAPEYAAVSWPVAAEAPAQTTLHSFNFTDQPLLREFWLNLYFADEAQNETARALRAVGGADWVIEPGTEVVRRFECPIAADGHLLSLTRRALLSTHRLSAWLKRASGERVHILETGIDVEAWSYPYDSLTENPLLSGPSGGAFSGVLAFEAGDALEWECHIVNETSAPLTHVGDERTGAICSLTGATVGADIDCMLP